MASPGPPPDAAELSNSAGTRRVWVSPAGLPLHVQISPSLLSRGADVVAAEVVRLCGRAE